MASYSSGDMTASMVLSCGRATALPPARLWSKISTLAQATAILCVCPPPCSHVTPCSRHGANPHQPLSRGAEGYDRLQRQAILPGRRRHPCGAELWESDSTATGTAMVKDINIGDYSYAGSVSAKSMHVRLPFAHPCSRDGAPHLILLPRTAHRMRIR